MKKFINILFLLCLMQSAKAQLADWLRMDSLELKEIRTASDKILVAFFLGPEINQINTNRSEWSLNGRMPDSIHKWITPNWSGIKSGYEHHIYIFMPEPFKSGIKYTLKTPHGDTSFIWVAKNIFCESIKTNQSGYSALSKVRYANFAIWTGTGGGKKIKGSLPAYEVFEIKSGKLMAKGILKELGENGNSGDFVYRIDLSNVPEGGPYKAVVKGYGSSFPFGVGGAFSQKLAYISFRGLLYERCGIAQKQPYFDHDIRGKCHPFVYLTNSPQREAKVDINPADPVIKTHGGYHDAGDADRQDHHMIAPMVLLTYYEMFPAYFSDLQYNIPDKFDADFNPIGQGNGIPDIIDEAEWGTAIFEILQDSNGGVRSGTERNGYPKDPLTLDKDSDQYAAFRVGKNSTNIAAGLFAHLARMIKPYNKTRAAELQERAERAWAFSGDSALTAHQLYFYIQYYLLTGDPKAHQKIIALAPLAMEYEKQHMNNPRQAVNTNILLGAHFFSYLLSKDKIKDPGVVKSFQQAIRITAEKRMNELNKNFWPNGTADPNRWWGSQTAQGQYADPLIMQWRLSGEQKFIDAASQLMDYNQGLNPIGKSYLTGTGFDRTEDPLHHDSYSMKDKGWGPAPGLQVFGPGNLRQIKDSCPAMIPDIRSLPLQRQYLDSRRHVSANEFTIPESLAYPSVIYTIMSKGGIWDRKINPFKIYYD